jgi:6-phosphogluconolactonase
MSAPEQRAKGLFVGTYARSGGRGLVRIDRGEAGSLWPGEAVELIANASYVAYSPRYDIHYFVDEGAGKISACRYDQGSWLLLRSVGSAGREPCFLALDPEEKRLAVANYGDGSVGLFTLDPVHGLPESPPDVHRQHGSGPNAERQDGPHVHCARFSPDGRWLLITDLGSDQLVAFDMDDNGLAQALPAYAAPPDSGPRHVLFGPTGKQALLLSELASSLTVFDVEPDRLVPRQTVSTLPQGVSCDNLGGHLAMNAAADRVYVSNRGHDSITVFALDGSGVEFLQNVPTSGKSPRHFLLREAMGEMLVAHEGSETISRLPLGPDGSLRKAEDVISVEGAVFIFET